MDITPRQNINENDYDWATDLLLSSAKDGMIASVLNKKSEKKVYTKETFNIFPKRHSTFSEIFLQVF